MFIYNTKVRIDMKSNYEKTISCKLTVYTYSGIKEILLAL